MDNHNFLSHNVSNWVTLDGVLPLPQNAEWAPRFGHKTFKFGELINIYTLKVWNWLQCKIWITYNPELVLCTVESKTLLWRWFTVETDHRPPREGFLVAGRRGPMRYIFLLRSSLPPIIASNLPTTTPAFFNILGSHQPMLCSWSGWVCLVFARWSW